jgi:hypothetical protein
MQRKITPILATICASFSISFADDRQSNPMSKDAVTSIKNANALPKYVGKAVAIEGKAADAKLGAVVLLDEEPIYIESLGRWPTEIHGKRVHVSGTLEFHKGGGNPKVEGIVPDRYVLKNATWQVVQPSGK